MKAIAIYLGMKGGVEMIEVERPQVGPGEVLIAMHEVGIDGTDTEVIHGAHGGLVPEGDDFLILGHESLGRIEEVGRGAAGLRSGDWVVATVRRPDGCPNCRRGEPDMCLWGGYTERGIKGAHGFLAEYVREKPRFIVPIPEKLVPIGALVEPLSISEKAIRQAWDIQRRMHWGPKKALVFGLGTIGLLGAMLLKLRGLDTTIYSRESSRSKKARMLKTVGIGYISSEDVESVSELDEEVGRVDFLLEATGSADVAGWAMQLVARNGVLCLLSVTGGAKKIPLDVGGINRRLVLGNGLIFGSVNSSRAHFKEAIGHLTAFNRKWPGFAESLITRRVAIEDYAQAFEDKPGDIKVVIEISASRSV